ncbi:class I SAM-dependent methyltransferase [Pseudomonas sp. GL-R-26]|uniref:class I SAM-dependent methyltransferase n=1 Tax=Pseudomonas sp. GL-R-26 TaxID=2832392 RepID=UPI001CC1A57D|nr:class I SAM-dependent methyltransferase [Pseudomonas sp. GL-R-26]
MPPDRTPFPKAAFEALAQAEARHWWFRARNRVIIWVLKSRIGKIRNFLEIGCGTGFVLEGIHQEFPETTLSGTEFFDEGLMHARRRVPGASFEKLDARTMNDAERFDVIGAFDVIEHIDEDEQVLANLSRALHKDGHLLLTVPQHRWLWSAADERACHVRRYTRRELVDKVGRAGLEVQYVTSFVTLLVSLMWLARQRPGQKNAEVNSELDISDRTNRLLEFVMKIELGLLKAGITFPLGGSLLLLAKKR